MELLKGGLNTIGKSEASTEIYSANLNMKQKSQIQHFLFPT
jgi:hypothetical protein